MQRTRRVPSRHGKRHILDRRLGAKLIVPIRASLAR